MADEIYEGAIGIDLGNASMSPELLFLGWPLMSPLQVLHILVSPIMRAPTSRSVRHAACFLTRLSSNADEFHAVANEQGSFTTPSFVSFTDEERLIGEAAKNQAAMNPANTIFDIKYVLIIN